MAIRKQLSYFLTVIRACKKRIDIHIMETSWAWGPARSIIFQKITSVSAIYLISAWFQSEGFIQSKQDVTIFIFWKGTGVIKGANLLFTHGSLLLCDYADSHEMRWIKAPSDSVTLELCNVDYSWGFEFIKWVYCFILKDHTIGFWIADTRIFVHQFKKLLCSLTAENNRANQSFVLRIEISLHIS